MSSDKKRVRRSYARRKLGAEARSFAQREWRSLALVVGVMVLALVPTIFQPPYVRGLMQAFFAMATLGMITLVFAVRTHAWTALCGAWAEDNTREDLEAAQKRGHVWRQLSNIEVGGRDIDHIVFAPRGVLAIESKWALAPIDPVRCRNHAVQAESSAQLLRSILRSVHVKRPHEVVPLVVVWGKGAKELPDGGFEVDGVRVIHGRNMGDFLAGWRTGPVGTDWADETAALIEAFDATQVRRPVKVGS